jgi:hypothetical protein
MERSIFHVLLSATFFWAAACGGSVSGNTATSTAALSHQSRTGVHESGADEGEDDDCPDPANFDTVSEKIERELNIARQAVCKYRHLEAALADGYTNSGLPCVVGQGYHYIKGSLVGTTDIRHPSVLMYTSDGQLNGPEWIAPKSQFATPPSIFGQTMHSEDELGLWILHVWVWKLNPNGVFNDVNPNVTCP